MEEKQEDIFHTISEASTEQIYKEKGSKFLGYAYPVSDVSEVEELLHALRKQHPKARHWCYAWQLGVEEPLFRFNDDGEPGNSAGKPIFGQIQAFGLTDVLIVVVRYFGGTKLGVGGLINAYRSAAKLALENAVIVEKKLQNEIQVTFEYPHLDKIMRVIREQGLEVLDQKMEMNCEYRLAVRKAWTQNVVRIFEELRCAKVKRLN